MFHKDNKKNGRERKTTTETETKKEEKEKEGDQRSNIDRDDSFVL